MFEHVHTGIAFTSSDACLKMRPDPAGTCTLPSDCRQSVMMTYRCGHTQEKFSRPGHCFTRTELSAMRTVGAASRCPDCRAEVRHG
jgi:hypothetical protein